MAGCKRASQAAGRLAFHPVRHADQPARETGCNMSVPDAYPCGECGAVFGRYRLVCPECKAARWERVFYFVVPDADGAFPSDGANKLESKGLSVISADNSLGVIPKGDGRVMLARFGAKNRRGSKPYGDTLVKPIGYYYAHAELECEDVPVEEFPPLPAEQAIDRFLYYCFLARMSDKDMADKLKTEHSEWVPILTNPLTGKLKTRQSLLERAKRYQATDPHLLPIRPRKNRTTYQ